MEHSMSTDRSQRPALALVRIALLCALAILAMAWGVRAEQRPAAGHSIYLTAVEFKGSTTAETLAPPTIDPSKLSHGYAYKGPGQADPSAPQRWEVASYQFSPAFMTVYQGDSIMLSVFIVNGDHHDVTLTDPDGQVVIAKATWDRGREYTEFFQVQKVGEYHLECELHRPSMTATIMVLPR